MADTAESILRLVIDLAAVEFLSSARQSVVLDAHEQCADAGISLRAGSLPIVSTSHAVRRPHPGHLSATPQ